MSLFKRGHIYYSYVWLKGVRHSRRTGTGNRREAELIELEFKKELQLMLEKPKLDPSLEFGALAARFLANGNVKPYHLDRLKVLLPYFTLVPIGKLNRSLVADYKKRRLAQRALAPATLNRDVQVLRHLLFWAIDEGYLLTNPLSRIPMERVRRKPKAILSVTEEVSLLRAASPHLRDIIIAAADTGMRRGELLHQLWEQVDLERKLLWVTKSKTAEGEAREIPLTHRLMDVLYRLRQPKGLVFRFKDKPINRIKTTWRTAIRKGLTRHFRFHDLRHTFNTRLMEAGVMQEVRKALMGHSSGEDVHSMYTHVELPTKREAIARLEAWCAQELKKGGGERASEAEGRKSLPAGIAGLLPAGD